MALAGTGAELNHLTPRPVKGLFGDNYLSLTDLDFTQQFLPEVYEKEVERYGNRTISGFLRMVGAEMPMASDRVVWSEQGRLHIAFDDATVSNQNGGVTTVSLASAADASLIADGATIVIASGVKVVKARVTSKTNADLTVTPYGAADLDALGGTGASDADLTGVKVFVYG